MAAKTKAPAAKRNLLSRVGQASARAAQRELILGIMESADWSLTVACELLGMSSPSDVRRALLDLAPDEYEAARGDGRLSRANRT